MPLRTALIALLLAAPSVHAQIKTQLTFTGGTALPRGDFRQNVSNPGFGGFVFAGVSLAQSPVMIGVDAGMMVYGYERRHEPFSLTVPDVTLAVSTTNNIGLAHFVLRVRPPNPRIGPYAEGLIGIKYFFTQTTVRDEYSGEYALASSVNESDVTFSYGLGAGLDFQVYQNLKGQVKVSAGLRYLVGGQAEYLTGGDIKRSRGEAAFETVRSDTHMLIPFLGAAFEF